MATEANILVTGGAGYVGGTAAAWLLDQGYRVTVVDDLSTGFRKLVDPRAAFVQARVGDRTKLDPLLRGERFDACFHFAAKALAGESVEKPEAYFENNVEQTRSLLDCLETAGVKRFIFSSTCAVFGMPEKEVVAEDSPKQPVSPYGRTKLEVERMLAERASRGLDAIAFRYFNAAGAEPCLRVGELHEPETHLIPCIFRAVKQGEPMRVFGTDYPTRDGTCIRDYVHVWDLAQAHEAGLKRLLGKTASSGSFEAFNLGSERGFSVREVIRACESVLKKTIATVETPRRPGDPARLFADASRAKRDLGFKPEYSSIERIVETAWAWEKKSAN
jgi:UDP-glucose 4-epimerase